MKTVLFFLISLGFASVPTQSRRHYFDALPTDCRLTKAGREYVGTLSVTRSGLTCQDWVSDYPHNNNFKNSVFFPEGSASAAGNKCRNPQNNYNEGVWCYTTDPEIRWEECDVKLCVMDCKMTMAGHEYVGPLSETRSGRTCRYWGSDRHHYNYYKDSTFFPEGIASAAGNKCRNPESNYNEGVWCYTTDREKRWEQCDVKLCDMDCKLTKAGHEYIGQLSVTRSGRTCQQWNSDYPHNSHYKNCTLFPEGNASAAGNKCRNPDKNYNEGVWCYTTDPNKRWEQCDVEFCGWYRGEKRAIKFAISRIWPQSTNHSSNCYFCMVDPTKHRTGKDTPQIVYPDIPSSIVPVPHCLELPVPTPPKRDQSSSGDSSKSDSEEDIGDPDYVFTDALRREGHTSLSRKTPTI